MSQVTISSTTDSQEQVDRAADYDVEVGHDESPVAEPPHITITSSDPPADVDQAGYDYRDDEPLARDGRFTQQVPEKRLLSRPPTPLRRSNELKPSCAKTKHNGRIT